MSGLAGIFSYRDDAPFVDGEDLLRMREAMSTRGPDGAGLWISEDCRVGLAHRRLATIDTTTFGLQPMHLPNGTLSMVFDGAIYNYKELREDLQAKGYCFRTQSDTEVLLNLYKDQGVEMLHRLRGMFALALWDAANNKLLIARDPFGIKPLYYADDGKTFRFGSQVKALLAGGCVDTAPEPAGHVGFFLWGYVPEPYSLFKGIRALPAGSYMWTDGCGAESPTHFFSISDVLSKAENQKPVPDAGCMRDELKQAMLDTVRCHLVADVPVGMFLSSGIDSTTLAVLAREIGTADLKTFTLAFDEYRNKDLDEAPLAEKIALRLGACHVTRRLDRNEFESEYERIIEAMDQPTIDGINTYFVSKAVSESGIKAVFSGIGGDELFGGYPSFREVPDIVRWCRPFNGFSRLGKTFRSVSAPLLKYFTSTKYAGLLEYGGSYIGAYLLRRGLFMPWELPELLDSDLLKEGWDNLRILAQLEETSDGVCSPHLKVSALEMTWYMRNQLLRDSDWAGMAHGIEIRTPYVDAVLLKRIAGLMNAPVRPSKRDLAFVSGNNSSAEITARGKTGFAAPVEKWLKEKFPSRPERPNRFIARHLYKEYLRKLSSNPPSKFS